MRFCLNSIRKIIIRVTSSKRYQNVRSNQTILGPFANVTLTLCVSWVSTTNVPIFIEIRSGDKIRSIIFERSYGLQTVKLPRWRKTRIGCDWQSQFISRKTNLDHNKCIKIQMKIYIYSIYWISRPYLPRINSCFTNILNP